MEPTDNENNPNPRHWRDWPGLLQWSLQYQDSTHNSEFREMDPERRAWLSQALADLSKSEVSIIIDQLKVIVEAPHKYFDGTLTAEELTQKETALQTIADLVDNLDNAQDLIPLGGFEPILGLLSCQYPTLQRLAADVVGIAVQNHPKCQQYAVDKGAIDTLITAYGSENIATQISVLGAISALVRGTSPAFIPFLEKGGLSFILSVLTTSAHNAKLITKASFLLASLLRDHTELLSPIIHGGAIEALLKVLTDNKTDWAVREPCLWLLSLLSAEKKGAQKCKALDVVSMAVGMRQQVAREGDQPALQEVVEYLNTITKNVLTGSA